MMADIFVSNSIWSASFLWSLLSAFSLKWVVGTFILSGAQLPASLHVRVSGGVSYAIELCRTSWSLCGLSHNLSDCLAPLRFKWAEHKLVSEVPFMELC